MSCVRSGADQIGRLFVFLGTRFFFAFDFNDEFDAKSRCNLPCNPMHACVVLFNTHNTLGVMCILCRMLCVVLCALWCVVLCVCV